jgi:hypothetical protein
LTVHFSILFLQIRQLKRIQALLIIETFYKGQALKRRTSLLEASIILKTENLMPYSSYLTMRTINLLITLFASSVLLVLFVLQQISVIDSVLYFELGVLTLAELVCYIFYLDYCPQQSKANLSKDLSELSPKQTPKEKEKIDKENKMGVSQAPEDLVIEVDNMKIVPSFKIGLGDPLEYYLEKFARELNSAVFTPLINK